MSNKVTSDYADTLWALTVMPAFISVLIRGDHGIGKSALAKQMAKKFDLELFDIRLAQRSEGDIVGLPFREGDATAFLSPVWFKRACEVPSVIFFDEINRAPTEIMQAAFQIVLDRELNGCKLHPESRVYAAINTNPMYHVNDLDPALLDRFWVVDLEPTVEDWLTWALESGVNYTVLSYIQSDKSKLDAPTNSKINPGTVTQSRRSWEKLSDTLNVNPNLTPEQIFRLSKGFIGSEIAASFINFVKDLEQVFPEHIIEYNKNATHIKKNLMIDGSVQNMRVRTVVEKLMTFLEKFPEKITKGSIDNINRFIIDYGDSSFMEISVQLTSLIIKLEKAGKISKDVNKHYMEVYNKQGIKSKFSSMKHDVDNFIKTIKK